MAANRQPEAAPAQGPKAPAGGKPLPRKEWWTREEVVELVRRLEGDWAERYSEVSDAANRHLQELNVQDNELLEFDNIFKGIARRSTSAVDRAVDLFDSWTSGNALLLDARPIVHPPRRWPAYWQVLAGIGGLFFFGALTFALLFTSAGTGAGHALSKPGVELSVVVLIAGVLCLAFFLLRGTLERPVVRA